MLTKILSLINRTMLFSVISFFTLVGLPEILTNQGIEKGKRLSLRLRRGKP